MAKRSYELAYLVGCGARTIDVTHVAAKNVDVVSKEADLINVIGVHIYSWPTLLQVTGHMFRLISNLKLIDLLRKFWNRQQPLSSEELQRAENVWIRIYRSKYF